MRKDNSVLAIPLVWVKKHIAIRSIQSTHNIKAKYKPFSFVPVFLAKLMSKSLPQILLGMTFNQSHSSFVEPSGLIQFTVSCSLFYFGNYLFVLRRSDTLSRETTIKLDFISFVKSMAENLRGVSIHLNQ